MSSDEKRAIGSDAVERTMSVHEGLSGDLICLFGGSENGQRDPVDPGLVSLNEFAKGRFFSVAQSSGKVSEVFKPFETGTGEVHVPGYRGPFHSPRRVAPELRAFYAASCSFVTAHAAVTQATRAW
jgi:hypothetical protein